MVSLFALHITSTLGSCPYFDAYWRVNYNRGLKLFDADNLPEPVAVEQVGSEARVRVAWKHLVVDGQCVDRYILRVWDTPPRMVRHIFNSSSVAFKRKSAVLRLPMCTRWMLQVEMQEDDRAGRPPDSSLTFPREFALTAGWLGLPEVETNRSIVEINKTFSHWTKSTTQIS